MINIGDTLYYVGEFNSWRKAGKDYRDITSVTVTKVGRKYFYVDRQDDRPFSIDSLKHENKNYSQLNVQLYRSENDILDMFYLTDSLWTLQRFFGDRWMCNKLSKEDIQTIMGVIKPYLKYEEV